MWKIYLIIAALIIIPCFLYAQETTYTKISDTQAVKVTSVDTTVNIDFLESQKKEMQRAITEYQSRIAEIDIEIAKLKELGLKTTKEIMDAKAEIPK